MIRRMHAFLLLALSAAVIAGTEESRQPAGGWQSPPPEILQVLHAPQLPSVSTSPTGAYLLLMDPATYPPLASLAAPMHKLAGMRVDPAVNGPYGSYGAASPRLVRVEDGAETPLALPENAEIYGLSWTADGGRFALTVKHAGRIGVWIGSVSGELTQIAGLAVNPLLGSAASWLPDQKHLLAHRARGCGAPADASGPVAS